MQKLGFSLKSKSSNLLHSALMRSFTERPRLFINDQGGRNNISGIRATIFGATGFMGPFIGSVLGYISSDVVFPHCHRYPYDDEVKELKLCANLGQSFIIKHMNFDDLKMIDRVIANSNVVINLVGPRKNIRKMKDYEYANVEIPKRIAAACAKNPNIQRFIHFSAAGAATDSPSMDLSTKFHGEEAVRDAFPEATIFRPTTVYGFNDYFVRLILTQRDFLYNMNVVTDDCSAKRQPVYVQDVAFAVLNALKMHETRGKTFELGGPHTYSMLEIYEIVYNILGREIKLAYVPHELATSVAQYIKNWDFFNLDMMVKNKIDITVAPGANTISDLMVQPISFPQAVEKYLNDHKLRSPGRKDEMER